MSGVRPGEIRLRGVSRRFRLVQERNNTLKETLLRRRRIVARDLWVLRDVDLALEPGEAVGIVGRNGIGKSTLLRLMAGIIPPQSGTVETGGRVASLLDLGAGFHPDFTGAENVVLQAALYGLSEREALRRLDDIVAFAELQQFIEAPVKTYSSGMFMRLGFAIAVHVDADVMLIDEVLAVGDASFQRKCLGRIFEYRRGGGTLVFVSHDQEAVQRVCDRAVLIDEGRVIADGPPHETFALYNQRLVGRSAIVADGDAAAGTTAWGTGRVLIRDFRIGGPDGEATAFSSGDELWIEMDLVPSEPVATPVVGVNFYAGNGYHLYGTNNRMDGYVIDALEEPRTLRFVVPDLPLLEGRFSVSLTACSYDESEIFHHLEFCAEFSVFGQTSGVGPVRMEPRWTLGPAAAGGRRTPEAVVRPEG